MFVFNWRPVYFFGGDGKFFSNFRHGLVQILLVLFLVAAGIERLRGRSCPNKLFARRVIHIENQTVSTGKAGLESELTSAGDGGFVEKRQF